jgi:hypothetical protein
MDKAQKILETSLLLLRVEELLAGSFEDCHGHSVDAYLYRSFHQAASDFLTKEIGQMNPLTKEFFEVVTDNKKFRIIYARVILKELMKELETGEKSERI